MRAKIGDCLDLSHWEDFWLAKRSLSLFFKTKHRAIEKSSLQALSQEVWQEYKSSSELQALKKGDVLLVQGDKRAMIKGLLLCVMKRAIFCPIPEGVRFQLFSKNSCDKKVFLFQGNKGSCLGGCPELWDFLQGRDDIVVLLKTSGTKSKSESLELNPADRWVAYDVKSIFLQIQAHANYFQKIVRENRRLQSLPLFHTFGLILDFMLGIYQDQDILFFDSPTQILTEKELIKSFKPSILAAVPKLILSMDASIEEFKATHLHIGGARVSQHLLKMCRKLFKGVHLGYGMTECGPGVLMGQEKVLCELKILPDLRSYSQGNYAHMGQLWIKSQTFGLWRGAKQSMVEGFFPSGDLAIYCNGSYEIIGRLDDKIKGSHGRWVYFDELSLDLEKWLGLKFCKVRMEVQHVTYNHLLIYVDQWNHSEKLKFLIQDRLRRHFDFSSTQLILRPLVVSKQEEKFKKELTS